MDEYCSKPARSGLYLVIIAVLAVFMLQGCGGGGGGGISATAGTGILRGVIYASDSVTPVAGATVYVPVGRASTPEAAITSTVTAEDGSFTLTGVPAGNTVIKVAKDSWSQSINVTAVASETVVLPKATTTLLDTAPGSPFDSGSDDSDGLDAPPSAPFKCTDKDTEDMPPAPPFTK
ncbi:MAG: hypothetical protein ABFD64_09925 [Armatimonadota bacterium]